MKKVYACIIFALSLYFGFALSVNGFVFAKQTTLAAKSEEYNVLVLGDSIATGFVPDSLSSSDFYQDYQKFEQGELAYTKNSFAEIFSRRYLPIFGNDNLNITSKAVNGATSIDLLNLINSGEIDNLLTNANVIVLSIGGNNILGTALGSIGEYLAGDIELSELETQMAANVNAFYTEIDTIIEQFLAFNPNVRVFPMTVFEPYKFADLTEITVTIDGAPPTGFYEMFLPAFMENLNNRFQTLNTSAMNNLAQINNYILQNNYNGQDRSQNVTPIDVASVFEGFNKAEYVQHLNVDTSKMEIDLTSGEIAEIFDGNQAIISNKLLYGSPYLDLHPSAQGHQKIGEIYTEQTHDIFADSTYNLNGNLTEITSVEINYQHIGEGSDLTFYLEKISGGERTELVEFQAYETSVSLNSETLIGEGELIFVARDNSNNVICESNSLAYNIIDNRVEETIAITSEVTSGKTNQVVTMQIIISHTSNHNPNFKAYKLVGENETELNVTLNGNNLTINTADLVGENIKVFVRSFNGNVLLATSNEITTNFEIAAEPPIEEDEEPNNLEKPISETVLISAIGAAFGAIIAILVFSAVKHRSRKKWR